MSQHQENKGSHNVGSSCDPKGKEKELERKPFSNTSKAETNYAKGTVAAKEKSEQKKKKKEYEEDDECCNS